MQSKQTILIVVIVIAFGIAAILLGKSFMSGGGMASDVTTLATSTQAILPNGVALDFTKVQEFNQDKSPFMYPEVSPIEVGLGLGQMVR